MENLRMTFCGVIQKVLTSEVCPLDRGQCMWQHRVTHRCHFSVEEFTDQSFAERVGLPPISTPEFQTIRSRILTEIKESEL